MPDSPAPAATSTPAGIDPRGPRFGAAVTAVLLALTIVLGTGTAARAALGLTALLFLVAVARGVQGSVQGIAYRRWVRPRLAAPAELEDPRPPRFAQGIGLAFALVGLVGFTAGPIWLGYAATGMALLAALLNATVQVCLGCRIYGVCRLPQQDFDRTITDPTDEKHTNQKEAFV